MDSESERVIRSIAKLVRLYDIGEMTRDSLGQNVMGILIDAGADTWEDALQSLEKVSITSLAGYTKSDSGRDPTSTIEFFRFPGETESEFQDRRGELTATYNRLASKISDLAAQQGPPGRS